MLQTLFHGQIRKGFIFRMTRSQAVATAIANIGVDQYVEPQEQSKRDGKVDQRPRNVVDTLRIGPTHLFIGRAHEQDAT